MTRRSGLAWAIGLALAVWSGLRLGGMFTQPDAAAYLDLAGGRAAMAPFAWRQLGPLIVRAMAAGFHFSVEHGFLVEGLLALAVFLGAVLALMERPRAPWWMTPAVAGMFFWTGQFNGLALPDLLFAALLAVLLWLLSRGRTMAAMLMLFPLAVARESALLALACLLVAGWRRLGRREITTAVAATLAGLGVVRLLARHALPNREHLPGVVYLAAKLPGNLLRNVFGVELWADIYSSCATPRWQMALHLGPMHTVGVCRVGPQYPVQVLGMALASFGLLPLLLWRVRRVGGGGLLLRFCLLYGAVSFVAAPMLGFQVWRLFDYGWPLFLVALPLLVSAGGAAFRSARAAAGFVGLHLLVSWSVWWVFFVERVPLLGVEAVLYGLGWWVVRGAFRVEQTAVGTGEVSH